MAHHNHDSHVAAEVSSELVHSQFKEAHNNLAQEYHQNPRGFNHLMREIRADLHGNGNQLSVHFDRHKNITGIDFGGHDIFKPSHETHRGAGRRTAAAGHETADKQADDAGTAPAAASNSERLVGNGDLLKTASVSGDPGDAKATADNLFKGLKLDKENPNFDWSQEPVESAKYQAAIIDAENSLLKPSFPGYEPTPECNSGIISTLAQLRSLETTQPEEVGTAVTIADLFKGIEKNSEKADVDWSQEPVTSDRYQAEVRKAENILLNGTPDYPVAANELTPECRSGIISTLIQLQSLEVPLPDSDTEEHQV